MKLEPPLSNLVGRCQTICMSECCGIDAYDFSPIHIASCLLMWKGAPDPADVAQIRSQLELLKSNYGTRSGSPLGATFQDMNQSFTPEGIDLLANEILHNLDVALRLIEVGEPQRFNKIKQDAGAVGP